MTYDVVERNTIRSLVQEVNKMKENDWKTVGAMNSYVKDNTIESSHCAPGGLRTFKPQNMFYQTMEKQKIH